MGLVLTLCILFQDAVSSLDSIFCPRGQLKHAVSCASGDVVTPAGSAFRSDIGPECRSACMQLLNSCHGGCLSAKWSALSERVMTTHMTNCGTVSAGARVPDQEGDDIGDVD